MPMYTLFACVDLVTQENKGFSLKFKNRNKLFYMTIRIDGQLFLLHHHDTQPQVISLFVCLVESLKYEIKCLHLRINKG